MRVEVKSKVIPTSFLFFHRVGRPGKGGQLVELVDDQSPSPEAPPRSKRGGSKGHVRRGATARGAMKKSWRVRVIETKEVRGDNAIEYFLPTEVRSTFWIPER